jgi:diaminohydroxyphosphoribosylaminopyrimidine deaminase / 5-amino-6-(5-phosphoribosylamino)uracil reductase
MINFMQKTLVLAAKGRYSAFPNPMVGCIIEKNGVIVGQGWHKRPGTPHAEILALKQAGDKAKGANVYVNLEPCSHYGRTPPCVNALIAAQVKEVHIPFIDPNPLVNGKGVDQLTASGIKVFIGEEATAAKKLNEVFFHYITTKRPFVIAKWAMSLDGKTIVDDNNNKWITSITARTHVHKIRAETAAILVGINTILEDDPELTARHLKNKSIRQPLRVILDSAGKLKSKAKVLQNDGVKTLIATTEKSSIKWRRSLMLENVEVVVLPADHVGRIDVLELLKELGRREISSLLVEGGMTVLTSFFQQKLVNKIYAYVAPQLLSGGYLPLSYENIKRIGKDLLITADPLGC